MGYPADELLRAEDHVRDRIVLALGAVQYGSHRKLCRVDPGDDCRTEWTEIIKALGARPLSKRGVLADNVAGRDVVDAGIAMNKAVGLID